MFCPAALCHVGCRHASQDHLQPINMGGVGVGVCNLCNNDISRWSYADLVDGLFPETPISSALKKLRPPVKVMQDMGAGSESFSACRLRMTSAFTISRLHIYSGPFTTTSPYRMYYERAISYAQITYLTHSGPSTMNPPSDRTTLPFAGMTPFWSGFEYPF